MSKMSACPTCGANVMSTSLIRIGKTKTCSSCRAELLQKVSKVDSLQFRQTHVKHEYTLRSAGWLCYLYGLIFCVMGGCALVLPLYVSAPPIEDLMIKGSLIVVSNLFFTLPSISTEDIQVSAGFVSLWGLWLFYLGALFRRLDSRLFLVGTVSVTLFLTLFPFGTVASVYLLYLIHSQRGKRVLSSDYQIVRVSTPQIRYRRSLGSWMVLTLCMLLILLIASIPLRIIEVSLFARWL